MTCARTPFIAWLAALAASLGLVACGPGVGGTGTDSVAAAFEAYGAQPAALCASAPFAAGLACSADAATAAAAGTAAVNYLDEAPAARVSLRYQGQGATLDDRCAKLRFVGDWGITPTGGARFYGIYGTPDSADQVAAALTVAALPGGRQVLELRGLDERLLLGPVTLQRVTLPLPAAVCP